ncbi:hypothetical protein CKA32_003418 [Geitlerinema sp. FC II]|nr:hypothetical protein CKA32_003418 [Geitlerinema sp. FC II]
MEGEMSGWRDTIPRSRFPVPDSPIPDSLHKFIENKYYYHCSKLWFQGVVIDRRTH